MVRRTINSFLLYYQFSKRKESCQTRSMLFGVGAYGFRLSGRKHFGNPEGGKNAHHPVVGGNRIAAVRPFGLKVRQKVLFVFTAVNLAPKLGESFQGQITPVFAGVGAICSSHIHVHNLSFLRIWCCCGFQETK